MARIAFIGNFTRLYDEEGVARTLEKLGHTVIRVAEQGYNAITPNEILKEKPDFVLFAKLKIPMVWRQSFFDTMRANKMKTVCWMPDLFIGLGREKYIRSPDNFFQADLVFSPDGGHEEKWKEWGINHKVLRQGVYDEECRDGVVTPQQHSIAFIGTANGEFPYRQTLMTELSQHYGGMFKWFGRMNPYELRGRLLTNMIVSTKIIIGDSVYSPRYFSNRIFETCGRGGFIIHPNIEGLDECYVPYKEFVPYDYGDFRGLFEKIDYYLNHDDERLRIAKAGQERTKKDHTLLNRCKQLMEMV
jgi:hypothetical protein